MLRVFAGYSSCAGCPSCASCWSFAGSDSVCYAGSGYCGSCASGSGSLKLCSLWQLYQLVEEVLIAELPRALRARVAEHHG